MPHKKELPNKDNFIENYNLKTINELADVYNVSHGTIRLWAKLFGLKVKKAKANFQINEKIGNWIILEKLGMNKFGGMRWKVKCVNCNKKTIKTSGHIISSANSNLYCGCKKYTGFKEITGKYWKSILQKAKMRGIEVKITIEDAWYKFQEQDSKCAISGLSITLGNDKIKTASLDRINSRLPYTIDNIQWVDKRINIMKNSLNQDEFIKLCKSVSENNKG